MTDTAALAPLAPTPNACALPRRFADFATFGEALDYAAQGTRGLNFHDPRGALTRAYPFSELRADALDMARRLIARGIQKGDRVALVAETGLVAEMTPALLRGNTLHGSALGLRGPGSVD